MAEFTNLPDELISHIASLTPLREFGRLIVVSRALQKICDDNDSWYRRCVHEQFVNCFQPDTEYKTIFKDCFRSGGELWFSTSEETAPSFSLAKLAAQKEWKIHPFIRQACPGWNNLLVLDYNRNVFFISQKQKESFESCTQVTTDCFDGVVQEIAFNHNIAGLRTSTGRVYTWAPADTYEQPSLLKYDSKCVSMTASENFIACLFADGKIMEKRTKTGSPPVESRLCHQPYVFTRLFGGQSYLMALTDCNRIVHFRQQASVFESLLNTQYIVKDLACGVSSCLVLTTDGSVFVISRPCDDPSLSTLVCYGGLFCLAD
eukprot:TRINITY_DN2563_c0_g1_i5.p1 TRINITY_DN2563_c0_g1~~TRINITY_DN2563_c0_g1_i5.p1  ORF type:complete len:335 (+),score=33.79 TRINITY_DN2563_c0_g1_i5:53-1006(+)